MLLLFFKFRILFAAKISTRTTQKETNLLCLMLRVALMNNEVVCCVRILLLPLFKYKLWIMLNVEVCFC